MKDGVKQSVVEADLPVRTDQPGQTEIGHNDHTGPDLPVVNSSPEVVAVQCPAADVIDVGDKLERPRRAIRLPVRYRNSM